MKVVIVQLFVSQVKLFKVMAMTRTLRVGGMLGMAVDNVRSIATFGTLKIAAF